WRRILLYLPAGTLPGQTMASSQWWSMPQPKRQDLAEHLRKWILAHPDVSVGIYAGFQINDPCTLCMTEGAACADCGAGGGWPMCPQCAGSGTAHVPVTASFADMCTVYSNIEPWIELGVKELWFDAAGASNPASWGPMLQLAADPDYKGRVRFGVEPIIINGP